jgi:hypothetical protein
MWYKQIRLEDLLEFFKRDAAAIADLKTTAKKARSRNSEAVFPKLTGYR